ncbi:shikimate dehydrogenase [bacterium]|nr:shikimate dehydrogenase [bacterium]
MDIYGILAFPVYHSLSPTMHNAGFKALGINAKYDFFEIQPKDLRAFIKKVRTEKIKGLSVSNPHKQTIIPLLDSISEVAKSIGAVNTVYWKNNKLLGTNADWIGVRQALLEKTSIKNKNATVLGAGGASRAAIYALKQGNANQITILNRTIAHAEILAKEFNCKYGGLKDFSPENTDIVIQATSAGLNQKNDIQIIPKYSLRKKMTIMEMIYKPLKTKIVKDAEEIGASVITGERMLLHQGIFAFQLWTSQKAPFGIMEKALNEKLY